MKILWFTRRQFDIDKLHMTTWREYYDALLDSGHNVKMAIAGHDTEHVWERPYIEIRVVKKKFLRLFIFWLDGYWKFIRSYITFRPDAVILDIYSIWFSIPFVLTRKRRSVFIVDNRTPHFDSCQQNSRLQDTIMKFYTKLCYMYCRFFLNGMTVITAHYKQQVCCNYKFADSQIGVLSSGVNIDKFILEKFSKKKPEYLVGKFVLMQHGEISYNRGLFETVKALSLLSDDVCLLLIGESIKSNARNDLIALVNKLGLEDRVYVLPPVSHAEIPKFIGYCDCAVMAYPNIDYWNNNNPLKLLEYLALGKYLICTDMWTFRNVIKQSKCAYYLQDNDPNNIAQAVRYAYGNREKLVEWGKEGIGIVKEQYTWKKQAENLIYYIESLRHS